MHVCGMLSRVKSYFKGSRLVRMSSGTYCLVRDLGLVKGGKGLRHHETLMTFSLKGLWSRSRALHAEPFDGSGDVRPISDTGTNL
jgi:hypothetical protein